MAGVAVVLDTHVLVWLAEGDARLAGAARQPIEEAAAKAKPG
jgi:PIN domain nuclease of toxin-antitoxin system